MLEHREKELELRGQVHYKYLRIRYPTKAVAGLKPVHRVGNVAQGRASAPREPLSVTHAAAREWDQVSGLRLRRPAWHGSHPSQYDNTMFVASTQK